MLDLMFDFSEIGGKQFYFELEGKREGKQYYIKLDEKRIKLDVAFSCTLYYFGIEKEKK